MSDPTRRPTLGDHLTTPKPAGGPRPAWSEQGERLVDRGQPQNPHGFLPDPVPTGPPLRRGLHVDVRWLGRVAMSAVTIAVIFALGLVVGRLTAETEVLPSRCETAGNGNVVCTYPQDLGLPS